MGRVAGAACLLVAVLVPSAPVAASGVAPADPVVVAFAPHTGDGQRAAELAAAGLVVVDQTPGSDFALVAADDGAAVDAGEVVGGSIDGVDPLVTYRAFGVPDDPGYRYQWHLPALGAAEAWDRSTGAGQVVAVLDTGVAFEDQGPFRRAPDLADTRFAPGWDFVDGDPHPNDTNGHGTHVTSTIAATTDNAQGVAGLAHGATIMPLRVLDGAGAGSDWAAAQALRFAADHGAHVANLSFGGSWPSPVMADAVAYARSRGVLVVAASGNDGGPVSYPAALPGVVAVGAVRLDTTRAGYSNFGPALDLVAPGGDLSLDQDSDGYADGILQETFLDGDVTDFGYVFFQGTSMAAPQVSAVAALVGAGGVVGAQAVEAVLRSTAADLGPAGRDDEHGHGMVQADAAVRATAAPSPVGVRGIEAACPPATTPAAPFTDLAGSVHAAAVACVAWWEVAAGRSSTRFDPAAPVTRAQMASFVARLLEAAGRTLPAAPPDAFVDDSGSVHELRIDQLAAAGVVQGRGGGTYAPHAAVTRAEMATFLVRAHDLVASPVLAAGPDRFVDDDGSVHEPSIDKVAAAGLAAGTTASTFAPSAPVSRGQMATFLARTLDLFVATGATPAR